MSKPATAELSLFQLTGIHSSEDPSVSLMKSRELFNWYSKRVSNLFYYNNNIESYNNYNYYNNYNNYSYDNNDNNDKYSPYNNTSRFSSDRHTPSRSSSNTTSLLLQYGLEGRD